MPRRPRCYVASSLGFSEAGRFYLNRVLLPTLGSVAEVVDPWSLGGTEDFANGTLDQAQRAREIGRLNLEAIASSHLLAAVLDGQELDSGTAAEIGYASARGIICFGLRTDFRETGEPGATVNLQVEAFIQMSGGRIVANLEALVEALATAVDDLRVASPETVA